MSSVGGSVKGFGDVLTSVYTWEIGENRGAEHVCEFTSSLVHLYLIFPLISSTRDSPSTHDPHSTTSDF